MTCEALRSKYRSSAKWKFFFLSSTAAVAFQAIGTPHSGTPITLPATIEAESFDRGGKGRGYHQIKGKGKKTATTDGIRIVATEDEAGGAYDVDNFRAGVWLAYTVHVASTATFDVLFRVANVFPSDAAMHIEVAGVDVTGPIRVSSTGKWPHYQWAGKGNIKLAAGTHVIRLVSDEGNLRVNQFSLLVSPATRGAENPPREAREGLPGEMTSALTGAGSITTGVTSVVSEVNTAPASLTDRVLAQEVAVDTDLRNHPEILWYPRFDSLENAKADWTWMSPNFQTPYGVNPTIVDAPEFGMKAVRHESMSPTTRLPNGDGSSVMNWRQYINENTRGVSGPGKAVGNVPRTDLYLRYCVMMESDVPLGMTEIGMKLSGFEGPSGMGVATPFWHARPDSTGKARLTTYWFSKTWSPTGWGNTDLIQGKYLMPNKWHCLEQHLRLNTRNADGTFNADGLMEAWFDDELVYRQDKLLLHRYTGNPIEINSVHGQLFHGGGMTPKYPIHWRYTGFALAARRIGMPQRMH